MKITIVSPHRDDAGFSLGLTIGAWIQAGHGVEAVNCFTRSVHCPYGDLEFVHANDLRSYVTALRLREDERWSRQYRPPVMLADLNLRDAPQRLRCSAEEVFGLPVSLEDGAILKISRAVGKRRESALAVPLGLGDHVDHVTARVAASEGWGAELPLAFYEDLPYAADSGVAESIARRIDEVAKIAGALRPVFSPAVPEVGEAVARKRRLALCYDSQIDTETTERIAEFCVRYGGRERLWVNEAWQRSELRGLDA